MTNLADTEPMQRSSRRKRKLHWAIAVVATLIGMYFSAGVGGILVMGSDACMGVEDSAAMICSTTGQMAVFVLPIAGAALGMVGAGLVSHLRGMSPVTAWFCVGSPVWFTMTVIGCFIATDSPH